ncbi:MAG TPA: metalloregulator ArsR/SmtB family transcription factor [Thermoanaerobaculia bacterium]|nr:metalloregulator ArsR/SmtB family transcription factor [Thermoanaerobaculia bacterium]
MRSERHNLPEKEMAQIRRKLDGTPAIDKTAELIHLAGNATRLKILYLLDRMQEISVGNLAGVLGVSVSAVSQHLTKLKASRLVATRRQDQTIYHRLTEHPFNATLRGEVFPDFAPGASGGGSLAGTAAASSPSGGGRRRRFRA